MTGVSSQIKKYINETEIAGKKKKYFVTHHTRFTLGLQNDQVDMIHGQGRKAFVWTLDQPDLINQFINQGHFDGILSNYASLVAYNYYVKE